MQVILYDSLLVQLAESDLSSEQAPVNQPPMTLLQCISLADHRQQISRAPVSAELNLHELAYMDELYLRLWELDGNSLPLNYLFTSNQTE